MHGVVLTSAVSSYMKEYLGFILKFGTETLFFLKQHTKRFECIKRSSHVWLHAVLLHITIFMK